MLITIQLAVTDNILYTKFKVTERWESTVQGKQTSFFIYMLCLSIACEWLLHTLPQEGRFMPYKPASVHFLEQARFDLSKALHIKVITAKYLLQE